MEVTQALAFFEHGVGYALFPDAPRYGIDFGGAKYEMTFTDGKLTGTITAPNVGARHSSHGISFSSAGQDVVRRYGVEAHDEALRMFVRRNIEQITENVKRILFFNGHSRPLGEAGLDRNEAHEWVLGGNPKVTLTVNYDNIGSDRWDRWLPVVITVEATYQRKPEVASAPFAKMSDADLNKVISDHLEEDLWCDGEITQAQMPGYLRTLRARYRGYSPRIQTEIMAEVTRRRGF